MKGAFVQKNKYCPLATQSHCSGGGSTDCKSLRKAYVQEMERNSVQWTKTHPHLSGGKTNLPGVGMV